MASDVAQPLFNFRARLILCMTVTLFMAVNCRIAEEHMPTNKKTTIATPDQQLLTPSTTTKYPGHSATCFYSTRKLCPSAPLNCVKMEAERALLCCDIDSNNINIVKEEISNKLPNNQTIESLHVLNATLDELNISIAAWKFLTSIAFTNGNIKEVVGSFSKFTATTCLNISNNRIVNIEQRALSQLTKLHTLDLSGNNLTELPHISHRQIGFNLNIQGNKEMLCKSVLDALDQGGPFNFINSSSTFCTSSNSFRWFNSTDSVPITQVELLYEVKKDCGILSELGPQNETAKCVCDALRLDIVAGQGPRYSIKMNCSMRNLTKLPKELPPNTIELNISHNEITSLSAFSDNPSYENLRYLYADDNNIQSLVELEGTKFIDNLEALSLKANKIKSIPTYILSDAFDRNLRKPHVYLGNNYLHCDCTTAKVLKLWLFSKKHNVPDYDQLICENMDNVRVVDLAENKVCQHQKDWTDYINYIIAAEIVLLLGLISKVSYDYWVFKSAGYLPWPASKMPKLPCDWLCE